MPIAAPRKVTSPLMQATLDLLLMLALCVGSISELHAQGSTCNPAIQSCVPATGSGDCTPVQKALGQCTPGSGGGGSGGGGSGGGGGGGGTCTPSPGGSPSCGGSGPASAGEPGPSSGAGNPINLLNGNKYQEETDLPALPGVLGLELKRYYNSQSSHPGLLGASWRMSYETVLYDFGGEIQIVQADGRRLMFQRGLGANAALCSSPQPQDGQVRIEAPSGGQGSPTYYWRWADGRTLMFSGGSGGGFPLQSITAATGERVTLGYSPTGELASVRDPQGRKLVFIYASAAETIAQKRSRALKAIDTPLGRLAYRQDSIGRLIEVAQFAPSTDASSAPYLTRVYHYEDRYNAGHPLGLTGISVRGLDPQTRQPVEQRLSTYAYNAAGQAILSTKGRPRQLKDGKPVPDTGIEQVEVAYVDKALPRDIKVDRQTGEALPTQFGRAILTNSLGQKTQVISAVIGGHFRLIEMRGPGCSTCGAGDMRYGYDAQGLLLRSTQLDANGQPVRSELTQHDGFGRAMRTGVQAYGGIKPYPAQWVQRFEYADLHYRDGTIAVAPQPSLIARPSVIPGKEHTIRVTYNDIWQPTRITEEGFSPLDGNAQPNPQGAPIARITNYSYQWINGRSLLTQIDGPLPNGPTSSPIDSDITRLAWDADGNRMASATRPMGLTTKWQYDTLGRTVQALDAEGISTRYGYDGAHHDEPEMVERAGRVIRYAFDLQGRRISIDEGRGRGITLHYDLAGRLDTVIDAQGYKAQVTFDTEGQAGVTGLYEPNRQQPLRATYRWFDDQHRITKQLRADGRIDTWRYDSAGRVIEHLDGDDVLHLAPTNAHGDLALIELAPDGLIRANFQYLPPRADVPSVSASASGKVDDFGRTVVAALPGQGARLWTYDAANRLLLEQRLDRNAQVASRVRSRYDAAGRLTERVIEDAEGKTVQSARRRHEGGRLVEEVDDTQIRRLSYDEAGRVSQTTIVLRDENGKSAFETTLRTRYDPASGETRQRTLADSQVMGIERRDGDKTAQRITLQNAFWNRVAGGLDEWLPAMAAQTLQRWLPKIDVVHDIDFHPYDGIVGYTQGNGVSTRKAFDIAGRVTALTWAGQGNFTVQSLGYGIGPRISTLVEQGTVPPVESHYDYTGFGALKSEPVATPIRTAFNPGSGGAAAQPVERDLQGRASGDGTLRYSYTANGQLATIKSADGHLIATYRYNASSQRISKTLASGPTTYYLWQDGKLVAEIEGSGEHRGEITTQYLYLSDSGKASPIAKLETARAEGNTTGKTRMLFVHADFRGEPRAMTDDHQRVVWQARADAWGFIDAQELDRQAATMNLRLPGQYFDAESGLHDNWHRSYDARPGSATHGSYLSPDPMGYPDGPDAYRYVNGDPINKVDPTGLYEEDVHYYMTYFLALVSGLSEKQAQTVAAADRYIDDNPNTQPYAYPAREDYHFTQDGFDSTSDPATRYLNPNNPQLQRLHGYGTASKNATTKRDPTPCARAQLYGEFLHAYEDTYAHRDQNNDTFGPVTGHLIAGHDPDMTYNHGSWKYNEQRTLAMESAVFGLFHTDFGTEANNRDGFPIVWSDLEATMIAFNQDQGSEQTNISNKKAILNAELDKLGYPPMETYSCAAARDARNNNFKDVSGKPLLQSDYPGTILKTPTAAHLCK